MKAVDINTKHYLLIKNVLDNYFDAIHWEIQEVLMLGLSSSSLYKVLINDVCFVAKISDPHAGLNNEYWTMKIAAECNLSPKVHFSDADMGIVIMDYIEKTPLQKVKLNKTKHIFKFAAFIKKLASCECVLNNNSAVKRFDYVYNKLTPCLKEAALVRRCISVMHQLQILFLEPDDLKTSHGDINPYNLLFYDNEFLLVDWASASKQSLYFDLAACGLFFYYRENGEDNVFLTAYFGRDLNAMEKAKFYLMKLFVAIYYGIMFLYLCDIDNALDISDAEISALPTYVEFMERMDLDNVNLADSKTQRQLSLIYLTMAIDMFSHKAFDNALSILKKQE